MQELSLRDLYDGDFYHICTEGLEQVTLMKDLEDFRVAWNYLAICAWRTGVFVVGEAVIKAIKAGISIYAAHTNADKVIAGVSGAMSLLRKSPLMWNERIGFLCSAP